MIAGRHLVTLGVLLALGGAVAVERRATMRLDREQGTLLEVRRLETACADVTREVLLLRAGTRRHFDLLVRAMKTLRQAKALATSEALPRTPLTAETTEIEQRVESFKSDLSLLWNSTLHFPAAVSAYAAHDADSAAAVEGLRTAVARFSATAAAGDAERVATRILAFEETPTPDDPALAKLRVSSLGHARSILERRARVDDEARRVVESPVAGRLAALAETHARRHSRASVVVTAARTSLAALGLLAVFALAEVARRRPRAGTTRPAPLAPAGGPADPTRPGA